MDEIDIDRMLAQESEGPAEITLLILERQDKESKCNRDESIHVEPGPEPGARHPQERQDNKYENSDPGTISAFDKGVVSIRNPVLHEGPHDSQKERELPQTPVVHSEGNMLIKAEHQESSGQ